jgi:aminoglycoside/choline kinase family phosphotransferase
MRLVDVPWAKSIAFNRILGTAAFAAVWSSMHVIDASDSRLALLRQWVTEDLGFAGAHIEPASADASFRRYFRLIRDADSYIVMDAPPEKEAVAPFIGVAQSLLGIGLNVPVILARDAERGLLLLSDLGKRQYLSDLLADRDVERLYGDALDALVRLQTRGGEAARALPPYDRAALLREMDLLPEWFLGRHLDLPPTSAERAMLDRLFETLAQSALAQPAVFVHRDYHSRNLLVTDEANPGILDFQDAVRGAATYDVVSLLKDCYIAWPRERVIGWLLGFRERLRHAGLDLGVEDEELIRQFDLMGLQRHIKVLGIFARLFYRDGKAGYLEDLPRVLAYTREAAALYPETAEFARYIAERIDPSFEAAQARARSQAAGAGSAAAAPAGAASSSAASSTAAQSSHPPSR